MIVVHMYFYMQNSRKIDKAYTMLHMLMFMPFKTDVILMLQLHLFVLMSNFDQKKGKFTQLEEKIISEKEKKVFFSQNIFF